MSDVRNRFNHRRLRLLDASVIAENLVKSFSGLLPITIYSGNRRFTSTILDCGVCSKLNESSSCSIFK